MVDFKKLRERKNKQTVLKPTDIFRRLPKPSGINDLYTSQAEVLEQWFTRRQEPDIVIKLHTGGGKTLVGLLIAQSILNETKEPVLYLAPTRQLVAQACAKAREYGLSAVAYERGSELNEAFLSGRSILISTYQALFNAQSKFGVRGGQKDLVQVGAVILDDAHVAFSSVRESFTLRISKEQDDEGYRHLTILFRKDFQDIGRIGTFDDIVSGEDYGVVEVPYWSWKKNTDQVREYIRKHPVKEHIFIWPFLRDSFDYCHALISRTAFVITPIFPLVDMIPTFSDCTKRVYMSATIGDDSAILATFGANIKAVSEPITSGSLAGVSERMIIIPELIPYVSRNYSVLVQKIVRWATEKKGLRSVILVSSNNDARAWSDIASVCNSSEEVEQTIRKLQAGELTGAFVFANRYDGIDLPGDTCRLLVLSGLPKGSNEYDRYLAISLSGGTTINSAMAQRIEQGMGRAARGAGDYCVVIVLGKDLVAWLSRPSNQRFLTSSTRAQLTMGSEISKDTTDGKDLARVIQTCWGREKDWTEYHAETLAELVEPENVQIDLLEHMTVQRKAFQLFRNGYFEKAISKLRNYCSEKKGLDRQTKGWLLQLAARIAHYWENESLSEEVQKEAFSDNRHLLRPQIRVPYVLPEKPGEQAEAIIKAVDEYNPRMGVLAHFDHLASMLVPESSSNQFEQALSDLGALLGFGTDRPDHNYGIGPDLLWLTDIDVHFVIEVKSRKKVENQLTKQEHGQLLNACEWFQETYPNQGYVRVVVHPNRNATEGVVPGDTRVLTLEKLNALLADTREFIEKICTSQGSNEKLAQQCHLNLSRSKLTPSALIAGYLVPLQSTDA